MSIAKVLEIDGALLQQSLYTWVDVRSESEFERAHIPGAVNIPILNNEERISVGTIYKEKGREMAVGRGLHLVGPRFDALYQSFLLLENTQGKPLLFYCWRGGLRSQIAATFMQWSGRKCYVVLGGYKSFRQWVLETLKLPKSIVLLSGTTGSGKTEILHMLRKKGLSVLDLEGLASHKGSALGGIGLPAQPRSEVFENSIALEWAKFDSTASVFVENESKMIGHCVIPESLWLQMQSAKIIKIEVPKSTRIQRILKEYSHLPLDQLQERTSKLRKRLGGQNEQLAQQALLDGNFTLWVTTLLVYYDKTYAHSYFPRNTPSDSIVWDWEQKENSMLNLLKHKIQ